MLLAMFWAALRLIGRSWSNLLALVGTTTAGIVVFGFSIDALVALVDALRIIRSRDRQRVEKVRVIVKHAFIVALVTFAVLIVCMSASIVTTIYNENRALRSANERLIKVNADLRYPTPLPTPVITISWAGKPLEGQNIKVNPGGFELNPLFDFQSNVEIAHPSIRMMFSTRFSINGSIWQYTGQLAPGFVEGVQWYSDRLMYANQPWQGPAFSGGWTGYKVGDEKRPVNVRLELYYNGPSSPKVVNFRLVPGA
jgi:hypothetical protein